MKQKDVLALCSNDNERERVEAVYAVAERFKTTPVFDSISSITDAKKEIQQLVVNYEKRSKSNDRAKERREARRDTIAKLTELLDQATTAHISNEEVLQAVKQLIKNRYNEEIAAQIAELRAKMIE